MNREQPPTATNSTTRTRAQTHAAAEYALLGLLREGPRHGYALAAAFAPDGVLGEVLRLGTSQMYAYLHKLERQGWLEDWIAATGGSGEGGAGHGQGERTRRVFQLTSAGAHAFDAWIDAPVAATREVRLDFLLKLSFALAQDHSQAQTQARALLESQRAATAAWLARLTARLTSETAATPPDAACSVRALVLRHRVRQSEATLAWLDEAVASLSAGASQPQEKDTL